MIQWSIKIDLVRAAILFGNVLRELLGEVPTRDLLALGKKSKPKAPYSDSFNIEVSVDLINGGLTVKLMLWSSNYQGQWKQKS